MQWTKLPVKPVKGQLQMTTNHSKTGKDRSFFHTRFLQRVKYHSWNQTIYRNFKEHGASKTNQQYPIRGEDLRCIHRLPSRCFIDANSKNVDNRALKFSHLSQSHYEIM